MDISGRLRHLALRTVCAAAFLTPGLAFAADAPKLPASAKRLSGAAIAKLYNGKTFTFESFTSFGVATGQVSYDLQANTNHVTYALGAHRGTIEGTIRVAGDKFCYKTGYETERCNTVYIDGADIYEVRASGIVDSVKREGRATPPA